MAADQTIQLIFKSITDRARRGVKALRGDLQDTGQSGQAAGQKVETGFEKARQSAEKSRQTLKKYGIELDGQEVSIKQLRKQLDYLENQRDEAFDPDKIISYNREIRDLQGNIRKMQTLDSEPVPGMGRKLTGLVGSLGLAYGAAQLFQRGVARSIDRGREFESTLAELEAITGITGDRLDRLGDRSLEMSKKYGVAASNIIEANKLVASQLAQKIDFGTEEGFQTLQQISEQAVVLATAARVDLSDAVETTTSIINQFNLQASESERVINTLAAGAKYGAAEVPAIGAAMVNAGAAAEAANVPLELTNALIQELAANGQVGERAGTALRAIFTRLQTRSEDLAEYGIGAIDVKTNGLIETLRQLQPILNDTVALQKLFGDEAINQAQILIRNVDSIEDLQQKVTNTGVAYEQAEVNMDTFDGSMNRLQTTIDSKLIPAFTANQGVMRDTIDLTTSAIDATGRLITQYNNQVKAIDRLSQGMSRNEARVHAYAESFGALSWAWKIVRTFNEGIGTIESADRLRDYFNEIDTGTKQIEDRISLLTAQVEQFSKQQEGLDEDSQLYQYLAGRIKDASDELQNMRGIFETHLDNLRLQQREVKQGTFLYAQISEEIRQMETALMALTDAEERSNEAIETSNENREKQKDQVKTLSDIIKDNEAAITALIEKSGDLTAADREQIVELSRKNKLLKEEIDRRKELAQIPERPGVAAERPEEAIDDSINIDTGEELSPGIRLLDKRMAKEMELTELMRQENQARQELQQAQSEVEKQAAQEKLNMLQKMIDMELLVSDIYQESAMAQIESGKELLSHVIATTKQAIKAKIAEATATQVAKVLSVVPFPFNVAAAAAAGGAISLLFEKLIPDFEQGGFIGGRRHRDGGTLIEAERDEHITNRRSAMAAPRVLTYINSGPAAAREVQAIFDQIQAGLPVGQDGGVVGTDRITTMRSAANRSSRLETSGIEEAVRRGMEGVIVDAKVAISELDEELTRYKKFKSSIGN